MEQQTRRAPTPDPVRQRLGPMNLIAACGVMYSHAITCEKFGFSASDACGIFETKAVDACTFAVPFFFLASAFSFFCGFTWQALLPKWKRRIRTLLVPYLIWSTLYFLLFALLPRLPFLAAYINAAPAPLTLQEVLEGVLLHKYAGHLWFLRILFLFLLFAPVFYAVFSRRYVAEAALAGLFLLVLFKVKPPIAIQYFSFRMLFFYAAGAYLALRRPALAAYVPKKGVRIAFMALIPVVVALHAFVSSELYIPVMLVLLWLSIDPSAVRPRYAYSATFFVYLAHMLLLSVLKKLALAFLPHTQGAAAFSYLLLPLIALPILVGAAWLFERLLPRTAALFTGGRSRPRIS